MKKIALLILFSLFFVSCSKKEKADIVKVGYLPITHALSVFEEKDLLDSREGPKIELVKFASWSDLTDALNTGRIDASSVLIELCMSAVSKGIPLKAVALGHRDGNVVIVSNDIKTASDLKGKAFAIPHTQSSHNILLNDVLAKNGLNINDLKVVQLGPPEMPFSLSNGSISGYCVAEPFGAVALNKGIGHVLYDSKELWEDSLCCAFVFSGNFLKTRPETAKYIKDAYFEASKLLNKEEAKKIAKKYLGQEESIIDTSLQWISFNDLEITEDIYEVLRQKVINYNISSNPPLYKDFVLK